LPDEQKRLEREQHYLDLYFDKQIFCYNLCSQANKTRLFKRNKSTNKIIFDKRKNPKSKFWLEIIKKYAKTLWTQPSFKNKMVTSNEKRWQQFYENKNPIIVSNIHTGETENIIGPVAKWCRKNNISYKSFNLMLNGKIKISHGWFLGTQEPKLYTRKTKTKPMSREQRILRSHKQWKDVIIENYFTKEQKILGDNIRESCDNTLNYFTLRRLLFNKIPYSKNGWCLANNKSSVIDTIVGSCEKCKLVFSSYSGLRSHFRKFHKNE
jgi:hypothetical protein